MMNCCKHKYFVLYRGDSSDFPGNQELIVEINTTRDLTGCSAHFQFQDYRIDFDSIPADKKLHLVFPASETKKFTLGASDAKLWLTYGSGTDEKTRTVENRIHVVVTNNVNEAYDNDDPQAITVTISGGGGGATVVLDDTVTEESSNGVKSSGIWSWVKSLLPHWLTSDYAEPATVESVATKADKTALDDKRDKDDRAVYGVTRTENTDWTWTSENKEFAHDLNEAGTKPEWNGHAWWYVNLPSDYGINLPVETDRSVTSITYDVYKVAEIPVVARCTATRPRYMDETLGSAKTNQQLAAVATGDAQTPANGDLVKYDAENDRFIKAIAGLDYRDPQDNTCHKTEYGNRWIASNPPEGLGNTQPYYDEAALCWVWCSEDHVNPYTADGAPDAKSLTFSYQGTTFTATRSAVCTSNELFTTKGYVDGSISANDPSFVSAVRNTPTGGIPEDMPTDWGAYSTVGGSLAALAEGLKWCKNILGVLKYGYSTFADWISDKADATDIFDNYGKPSDMFTANLLGKPVANIKANSSAFAPEYDATSKYAVDEFVWHDGNIYQCKTAIPEGGEAWNAEHWELRKLDDFFTESNSLLTATIDDRLPIPISAKSEGFTTESYKRFIVTVSGDMTVTLHTPTSGDAEIFECRFNGSSLSADASITFAGATATTMDANCGTVTAGKIALMSAFWNGTTWDVNWKVEG